MKYLIKIEHYCPEVKTEPQWFVLSTNNQIQQGVIHPENFAAGPLPKHDCRHYYYRQSCEEDVSCFWQSIIDVMPWSKEQEKRLNARPLDSLV